MQRSAAGRKFIESMARASFGQAATTGAFAPRLAKLMRTNMIASTVATVRTGTSVGNTADLMRFKNAVLHGSISQQILTSFSAPIEIFEELDDALNAVINGTADTVVADSLILSYLVNHKFKERLMLLDMDLAQARVAMAMPVNSPLREPLNVALLAAIRTPEWREATTDYLANEHHNFP